MNGFLTRSTEQTDPLLLSRRPTSLLALFLSYQARHTVERCPQHHRVVPRPMCHVARSTFMHIARLPVLLRLVHHGLWSICKEGCRYKIFPTRFSGHVHSRLLRARSNATKQWAQPSAWEWTRLPTLGSHGPPIDQTSSGRRSAVGCRIN